MTGKTYPQLTAASDVAGTDLLATYRTGPLKRLLVSDFVDYVKEGWFAAVTGETGVINYAYAPGDVRRYGVFPDGVTNWETAQPAKMIAIYANSCLPNLTIYWPPGEYNTSMNVEGPTYDGSKMFFDNAIFNGIVHLIDGLSDVEWLGTISTYDRHGITSGGSTNLRFGKIICLNNPAKNIAFPGVGGRGVHWVAASNIVWDEIDVVDCAAASTVLPGTTGNLSAVWIESQGLSGIRGNILVRQSQTNGVFINGLDLDVNIRVDGYGAQAINAGGGSLEGLTTAMTQLGSGVILHRCTGRVGYKVAQSNALPLADTYVVLVSETGTSATPASRDTPLEITYHDVTVGNGNRGVCIGAAEESFSVVNTVFSGAASTRMRSANTLAATYAGFNVLPPPTAAADTYRRLVVSGSLEFSNFSTLQEFKASAVAAMGNNSFVDLNIEEIKAGTGSGRCVQVVGLSATGGRLRGRIGNIAIDKIAGGSAAGTALVDIDGTTGFTLGGGNINSYSTISMCALRIANNVNGKFAFNRIQNFSDTGSFGGLAIDTNTGCTIGPCQLNNSSITGAGVMFVGAQIDCVFYGLVVKDSFSVGFDNGTGLSFTNPTAIGCISTGNTDNTDITLAQIPAANCLGCVNLSS